MKIGLLLFDRELIPKSLLKYFLKEGVSLQQLFLMWGMVQILILLYCYQLRYEYSMVLFDSFYSIANNGLKYWTILPSIVEMM